MAQVHRGVSRQSIRHDLAQLPPLRLVTFSFLQLLLVLTITDSGEAYMMMENMVAAKPQKSFLPLPCRAKRDTKATKATAPNTESTNVRSPNILAFSFLGAYMMKNTTYMNSIPAPVPLIVDTNMLLGDTKGRPYLQLSKKKKNQ
jgi:hypothetical protein